MKSYRMGWIAFSILLLLAGCQHQSEEIGLTAVSAVYQKQQAENQKNPEFAEQNTEVIAAFVDEVVKLRFQRAGEALASHLSEACRERFIAANQAVTGTDYGLARLGKLESCTILTINDNTVLAQINASYGDTPAAYTLVLTLIREDQTWLVDQMRWRAINPRAVRWKVPISLSKLIRKRFFLRIMPGLLPSITLQRSRKGSYSGVPSGLPTAKSWRRRFRQGRLAFSCNSPSRIPACPS